MRKNLLVGKGKKFETIQKAIDAAEENSTIEIEAGLYKENLVITKPGLKIKQLDNVKRNPNEDVILISETGPTIFVDISIGEKLQLSGLKLTC